MRYIVCAISFALISSSCTSSESTEGSTEDLKGDKTIHLKLKQCDQPNRFVPPGELATPTDVARDAFCGDAIIKRSAPKGVVVMFGSSRLKDGTPEYANARAFAKLWTEESGGEIPILTGGGPGLMEAGNRGAKEAGGPSLGFSTFFKAKDDTMNTFVTDGYMFSDFEVRERALLHYARAAVILPGGVGTAWEFFMTLSNVQTKRMNKIPVILMGSDVEKSVMPYLNLMKEKGTISPEDIGLFKTVDRAEDAVNAIEDVLTAPH